MQYKMQYVPHYKFILNWKSSFKILLNIRLLIQRIETKNLNGSNSKPMGDYGEANTK